MEGEAGITLTPEKIKIFKSVNTFRLCIPFPLLDFLTRFFDLIYPLVIRANYTKGLAAAFMPALFICPSYMYVPSIYLLRMSSFVYGIFNMFFLVSRRVSLPMSVRVSGSVALCVPPCYAP